MEKKLYRETSKGEQLTIVVSTERGYWSVTGELRMPGSKTVHSCGCLHKEVLSAAFELAPLVGMHLSDVETGAPMHAVANATYYRDGLLQKHEIPRGIQTECKHPEEYWFGALCRHLNMPEKEVRALLQETMFSAADFERELSEPGGSVYERWVSLNKVAHAMFKSIGAEGGIPTGEAPTSPHHGLSFQAEYVFWNGERKAQEYDCTLTCEDSKGKRSQTFKFYCGSAHEDGPDLDMLLECLILDARTGEEYANDPQSMADDMGLGCVQAQDMLANIEEQTKKLEFVLGDARDAVFAQYTY